MDFFPPDPETPEPEVSMSVRQPRWQAADDELPVLLPVSETLAVTDHLALGLFGIAVYSDGVEFHLEGRLRRNDMPPREWSELCTDFVGHGGMGGLPDPGGRLRFGLVLGDGEKVLDEGFPYFGHGDLPSDSEVHSLSRNSNGAGGDDRRFTSSDRLWLWPLPPEGPIEFVLQWPALDVEERRIVLDGTAMRELATRVQRFWS